MAAESYKPKNGKIGGKRIVATNSGDATAHLLSDGTLVVPGSNSAADYRKYNLRIVRLFRKKLTMKTKAVQSGRSRTVWHQGFLAHARDIQLWLKRINRRPKYVIGHSLGAAAVQVLSISYSVPGIGFAAPRICMAKVSPFQEKRCLLITRSDDIVAQIPEGFSHLGRVRILPSPNRVGHKHSMAEYTPLLPKHIKRGHLPKNWP